MSKPQQIILKFQPCINNCNDPEPALHNILTYYFQQGFDRNDAEALATEYLTKLYAALDEGLSS